MTYLISQNALGEVACFAHKWEAVMSWGFDGVFTTHQWPEFLDFSTLLSHKNNNNLYLYSPNKYKNDRMSMQCKNKSFNSVVLWFYQHSLQLKYSDRPGCPEKQKRNV